jgi:hypothetical protein
LLRRPFVSPASISLPSISLFASHWPHHFPILLPSPEAAIRNSKIVLLPLITPRAAQRLASAGKSSPCENLNVSNISNCTCLQHPTQKAHAIHLRRSGNTYSYQTHSITPSPLSTDMQAGINTSSFDNICCPLHIPAAPPTTV